jgi:hypothetical protein
LLDEKAVPPDSTPPIAFEAFLWSANEKHGAADDNGHEEDQEIDEALCGENGFPYRATENIEDAATEGEIGGRDGRGGRTGRRTGDDGRAGDDRGRGEAGRDEE